jgi:hypothetical protein
MENSAVNTFNQLAEIVHALNHDLNAFNTLLAAINVTNDLLYSTITDFTTHRLTSPLAHPDGSVTANKLAGVLDLSASERTVYVRTPPL